MKVGKIKETSRTNPLSNRKLTEVPKRAIKK